MRLAIKQKVGFVELLGMAKPVKRGFQSRSIDRRDSFWSRCEVDSVPLAKGLDCYGGQVLCFCYSVRF